MRYTAQKKIQLFLEGYDSGTDARLDSTLDEPCKGDTKTAPPSSVDFGNIKISTTYSQK